MTEIIRPIAAELQQFEAFFEQTLKADTEPTNTIMQYVLETKGKRLRPILVLLSAKLFGEVNERTLRTATFVEMVHSATLIHDDVVDDDDLRRGQTSVKARFGNLSAVLVGDYLLARAMLLISQPDDYEILQEMLRTTAAMSEGELMQGSVGLSHQGGRSGNRQKSGCHDMTALQNQYFNIITHKTATLMRSCCATGAMSVGATAEQVNQISAFGLCFGQLFQMHDDLLDGDDPQSLSFAQQLLPTYLQKAHALLDVFPESEVVQVMHELVDTLSFPLNS